MQHVLLNLVKFWFFVSSIFKKTYTANKCGHKTKSKGVISEGDYTTTIQMPLEENGNPNYCLKCIENMSIQCAWCGDTIGIGSPITLYIPKDTFEVPDYAVSYTEGESKALVGCLGWECAHTGGDRAGFWLPDDEGKGHVYRVPTAIEAVMANGGKSAVFISDISDIEEAKNPTTIPL